jgi:hypothetical protein
MNSIKGMIGNTITLIGSPIGIFILILFVIIIIEALVIWLLLWIIKNQFNKNLGVKTNEQARNGSI